MWLLLIIGLSLPMKKIRMNKSGFSFTEISVAVLIFALVAIPLYYAISFGSKEEIQLDKIAIANKILESFKDEIKNLDYPTVESFGEKIKSQHLPPNSFQELLKAQQKYKDFEFEAESKEDTTNDVISRKITAEVKWTNGSGKTSSQKISFIKVQ